MANAKVTVTTRMTGDLHEQLSSIAEAKNASVNGLVIEAVEQYIQNQFIRQVFETDNEDYFIRVVLNPNFKTVKEISLCSNYEDKEHITFRDIDKSQLDSIMEYLNNSIDLIEKSFAV